MAAAALFGSAAAGTAAGPATLVIHRSDSAVELFFSLPAEDLAAVFSLPPERLIAPDGTVDFEPLRLGTWEIGDAAFASTRARIGGQTATFEAMSLMVHPNETMLPLANPVDGLISIAVCTVPTPAVPPSLEDLRAYAGYIAYTDRPEAPIALDLPSTGRAPFPLTVLDFTDYALRGAYDIVVEDGARLEFRSPSALPSDVRMALFAAMLVILAAAIRLGRAENPRPEAPDAA